MARVFVSSTYLDLKACREQVRIVLRQMDQEDVAMEYYVAENGRPISKCLADVAACDVYIGLFAWRYGWVPPTNNRYKRSITELEYRQALRTGKECLIFLLDEEAPWPRKFIDRDGRIEKIRAILQKKHLTSYFKSVEDIGSVVAAALHQWLKRHEDKTSRNMQAGIDLRGYYAALKRRFQYLDLEG